MHVQPLQAEAPVPRVAIGGLKVTGAMEFLGVPSPATQVRHKWQRGPKQRYFLHEDGVRVDGAQDVEQTVLLLLNAAESSVK